MRRGTVDIVASDFVIGWAEEDPDRGPAHVYAKLRSSIIGFARSDIHRKDLDNLAARGELLARAFIIVFDRPISAIDLEYLEIHLVGEPAPLGRSTGLRVDRFDKRQIFILGSPRSGTSELAATLAGELGLPWVGEGHAAPLFAESAATLTGDEQSPHDLLRFMARQRYRDVVVQALRRAYYFVHGSASFLDKTPGTAMIRAAPFLAKCFPGAHFIYMRRNGISNVLSRMAKFGGPFDEHCADWAAAMDAWSEQNPRLPHYLEVDQEEMLDNPGGVAAALTAYLGLPDAAEKVSLALAAGARERTGAGIGRTTLTSTGWSEDELQMFRSICAATMVRERYKM